MVELGDCLTEKTASMLSLDLTNPANGALTDYARRIGALLTKAAVLANTDLAGSLDDFLGVVYALIQAKQYGFTDRTAPIDITAVEKRASMIAAGKVRLDGKWIAGGYFNNALFRTAAIYHRVLKIIVGGNGFVPTLLPKAQALYPQWTSHNLDQVHTQVNDLKHTPRGVHDQRTVTFAAAVAAAGELLDLIEAWTAANVPVVPKQQGPTP
jgi:hypothetical protein